ncbi:4'-phosphopantetheinyl transferase superfamily [Dimargaris cristalligena]|uniref:holo-[acyl-carrier-protein] synthase n=1 Tax=Dimargaris cristalligena TaxID=215637 RepID=A0A4P9ZYU6_9FUNG|nr:4'-phosphopantetheinyl transferase superfamily [Dimargaris cristalligena]|eukprot:RKP38863.1 4'-phosphopantetheinyl transferase superfamily [Dimargaris cristalligena]
MAAADHSASPFSMGNSNAGLPAPPSTDSSPVPTDLNRPVLVQWAFNVTQPGLDQRLMDHLLTWVQTEERTRIQQFMFDKDRRLALVGRILMRCFLFHYCRAIDHSTLEETHPSPTRWWDVQLTRSAHNKPIINSAAATKLAPTTRQALLDLRFNLSHHGNWVIFVAGRAAALGVDVSRIEPPRHESVSDFFSYMTEQFTPFEWACIQRSPDPRIQLAQFHRFWCLKESFVKAKGVGLNLDLQRIEFHRVAPLIVTDDDHTVVINNTETNISVTLDGHAQPSWHFLLTAFDSEHPVAIAYIDDLQNSDQAISLGAQMQFRQITPTHICSWIPGLSMQGME